MVKSRGLSVVIGCVLVCVAPVIVGDSIASLKVRPGSAGPGNGVMRPPGDSRDRIAAAC